MPRTLTALAVIALVVGACGGGGAAATTAPTAAPGGPAATEAPATAEATEGAAATTSGGGGGGQSADDLKALAAQLTPGGTTEIQHMEATGVYQLYLSTSMSIDQLTAFYDQKAASIPIQGYTKVVSNGSLYIGGSDPVVGIVAAADSSNPGTTTIVISVGSTP